MFIPIVLGTSRKDNQSLIAADYIFKKVQEAGIETVLIKTGEFVSRAITTESLSEEKNKAWQETMQKAQGLIVVSPEYNHGYPGELKLLLDSLYPEYHYKPLGIVGVSSRLSGGLRMAEQLRLVGVALKMTPIYPSVHFMEMKEKTEKDFRDDAKLNQAIQSLFDELKKIIDSKK